MITIRMEGLSKMKLALARITFRYSRGYKRGLKIATKFIFDKSQELVPVDTGHLKSSGYWEVRGDGFRATSSITYSARYAIYVHENLFVFHEPPTTAKFVDIPMKKHKRKVATIIWAEMAKP